VDKPKLAVSKNSAAALEKAEVRNEGLQGASERRAYPRSVRNWLILGLVLIFVQVVVGGITRLTGSGLSITKWEIVTGSLPPLNETDWLSEFDLYKATPQYE
jgi:cytochrome c oxidase assembly protein subunit 15